MTSRLPRLFLCLIVLCVVGGAGASPASAATTINLTIPTDAHANSDSTITASGELDDPSYVIVDVERDGTTCTGNSPPPSGVTRLGVESVDSPGLYSKPFTFHPFSTGTYRVCGYLISKTGGPTVTTSATVTVSEAPPSPSTIAMRYFSGLEATLEGGVDPKGNAATWHFEYGTTDAYGQTAGSGTVSPGTNGAVSADIAGLTPGTTYHYRLVASNAGGTAESIDRTFTTAPASTLALSVPSERKDDEQWPITASGTAGGASTIRVVYEPNASSCAATYSAELARPGAVNSPSAAQVQAGSYSVPLNATPRDAGNWLICGYLLPQSRPGQTTPEATASASVTVTHYACPTIDVTVTPGPTPSNADFDRGVNKINFTVDVPANAGRGFLGITSSDGGTESDELEFTGGGRFTLPGYFHYEKSIRPSYSRAVTVTFTITYSPEYPHTKCVQPDGTVFDSTVGTRKTVREHTVTFRNHGTPPNSGGEGGGFEGEEAFFINHAI
ncbi:MAG TPA: hypothetical protein VF711_07500, partial [Acidimicrobiales bacterium]